MIRDVEHVMFCHAYIFFCEVAVQIFCLFFVELLIFLILTLRVIYIFYIQVLYQVCKYFLPVCSLSFYPLNVIFHREKKCKNFYQEFLIVSVFLFMDYSLSVKYKNYLNSPKSQKFILCFTFVSVLCFKLIFL